jgi:hypothetical protein
LATERPTTVGFLLLFTAASITIFTNRYHLTWGILIHLALDRQASKYCYRIHFETISVLDDEGTDNKILHIHGMFRCRHKSQNPYFIVQRRGQSANLHSSTGHDYVLALTNCIDKRVLITLFLYPTYPPTPVVPWYPKKLIPSIFPISRHESSIITDNHSGEQFKFGSKL